MKFHAEKNLNDIRFCNKKERKDYANLQTNIQNGKLNNSNITALVSNILKHR